LDSTNSSAMTFGQFCLDLQERKLSRNAVPIKLKSRALDILCVLVAARGNLVTKDDLMAQVWPGLVVEENNIQVHISALRKALDEGRGGQVHIVTVPGRGYRLIGVQPLPSAASGEGPAAAGMALPDRPSIAVLPFQNMSSDPEQGYFAEGVVEDIIAGLSRIKWLFVIGRNSSFIYKGRTVDVKQVGRDLGVRYVLDGSVRKAANRVRITAQLIEAHTGIHLWTERYDGLLDDIFAVQDEIAMSVIGAIEPGLQKIEIERVKRKRPDSMDAYDLVLRALPFIFNLMPSASAPAIPLLDKALELEPAYSLAHANLAWCFHIRFSRGGLRQEDRIASIRHARAAISGGGDNPTALAIAGFVIWFDAHDVDGAFDLFDRALALSDSNVVALCTSAVVLAWMGKTETAIERARRALRLSPFDSLNYLSYQALAGAYFHLQRYAEARDAARRAVESNPCFSVPHAYFAAALMRLGCVEEAKVAALQVLTLDPTFTIRRFSVTVGLVPAVFTPFADAWRESGLPDE
jgi:TolB-like protein/tetratricopeptide (TPR) repeat protein